MCGASRPNNCRRHPRPVEDGTRRDTGDIAPVTRRDARQHREQFLKEWPAAKIVDDKLVLGERAVRKWTVGLGPTEPALGQEAAGYGAVAQQRNTMLLAQAGHTALRSLVE